MRTPFLLLALACLFLPLFSCEVEDDEPEIDLAALKTTFQEMEDRYAQFRNAGQIDSLVFYYADDIVTYSPEEPVIRGRTAVLTALKEEMAEQGRPTSTLRFEALDVYGSSNHAVEVGKTYVTPEGEAEMHTGNYMVVFERQSDDSWKAIREMYNDRIEDDDDDEEKEGEGGED